MGGVGGGPGAGWVGRRVGAWVYKVKEAFALFFRGSKMRHPSLLLLLLLGPTHAFSSLSAHRRAFHVARTSASPLMAASKAAARKLASLCRNQPQHAVDVLSTRPEAGAAVADCSRRQRSSARMSSDPSVPMP